MTAVASTRLAVFGLGYVGTVSAACLAELGHPVVGVDVNADKVAMVNDGQAPIVEEQVGELLARAVGSGRLWATTDAAAAVAGSELALVCVGTPSLPTGAPCLAHLERVVDDIGAALPGASGRYTVAVRSTTPPGTCQEVVVPRLEKMSGLAGGRDFGVCVNPEFLREGSSVADFFAPSKTLIGQLDEESGESLAALYAGLPGPSYRLSMRTAEMIKYVDNAFHALKVGFANEVGALCKTLDLDSHEVMDIFCADRKLNLSPAYLRPGFAFGGSCLPKDLRALVHVARHTDLRLPILENVLASNEAQITRVLDLVTSQEGKRVGIFGLSFKPGTDDLRESPMVELAERLLGRGFDLCIHDPQVAVSRLLGTNRAYVEQHLPHLSALLTPSAEVAADADVCVLSIRDPDAVAAVERTQRSRIIDLARAPFSAEVRASGRYIGVSW
jgi:GDP-mannose 6-dehydrogenase